MQKDHDIGKKVNSFFFIFEIQDTSFSGSISVRITIFYCQLKNCIFQIENFYIFTKEKLSMYYTDIRV